MCGGMVCGGMVCGGMVCGGMVCGGMVCGGMVCGGMVCGGMVCGGMVCGGMVCGGMVCGGMVCGGMVCGGMVCGGMVFGVIVCRGADTTHSPVGHAYFQVIEQTRVEVHQTPYVAQDLLQNLIRDDWFVVVTVTVYPCTEVFMEQTQTFDVPASRIGGLC